MTNGEAIKTLQANYPDSCYGLLRDAVDTAIYALSVQSDASNALSVLDCISRQAAINAIENTECELTPAAWDEITDAINELPSADAVNVVRCAHCKHYNNIDFHCYYHGSICFKPNDYCPYGEVRNNG